MTSSHDQMVIVQKYEAFINYFYPVAQNIPRQHGVVKEMFTRDMLQQVTCSSLQEEAPVLAGFMKPTPVWLNCDIGCDSCKNQSAS